MQCLRRGRYARHSLCFQRRRLCWAWSSELKSRMSPCRRSFFLATSFFPAFELRQSDKYTTPTPKPAEADHHVGKSNSSVKGGGISCDPAAPDNCCFISSSSDYLCNFDNLQTSGNKTFCLDGYDGVGCASINGVPADEQWNARINGTGSNFQCFSPGVSVDCPKFVKSVATGSTGSCNS